MRHESSHGAEPNIATDLEPLVRELLAEHRAWLNTLGEHRDAIARADAQEIGSAVERERGHIERVGGLDQRRRRLAGGSPEPMTLTALSAVLPKADRARVIAQLHELRELIASVRTQQRLVRESSTSLLGHMQGLMAQVAARLSHAGTYGAAGRVESGPVVVSGLDVRQ